MAKRTLSLSVHQLVDYLFRSGDIDDRVFNSETMQEGSRLHSSYQSKQGEGYISELALSCTLELEGGNIALQGRADGLRLEGDIPVIEEIKTTIAPVKEFAEENRTWHRAQAVCYAYMYLNSQGGEKARIILVYFHQVNTEDTLRTEEEITFEDLRKEVFSYGEEYLKSRQEYFDHLSSRDASVKKLSFPYPSFRLGQRELSKYVYGAMKKKAVLFAEAPTGIGKTMSTLYPAVLGFKQGRIDRLFYLTAKTTGALSALSAAMDLKKGGADLRPIALMAKEKICFCPDGACNPDNCPFAKGYYTKLRNAIARFKQQGMDTSLEGLRDFCLKEELCPFEFQLDISLECDLIIGDYNYFFDPIVFLERYFGPMQDPSTSFLLLDEAHNLLSRVRDMYSSALDCALIEAARKSLTGDKYRNVRKGLLKVEMALEECAASNEGYFELGLPPNEVLTAIASLKNTITRARKKGKLLGPFPSAYREFSREANRFERIAKDYFSSQYRVYGKRGRNPFVRLYCIDPSGLIKDKLSTVAGAVLFSATLSPVSYYMDSLLGSTEHPYLLLSSPFPKENIDLLLAPKVSVRYKDRTSTYEEVAKYLMALVASKTGNYFLYFPSYEYLEGILPYLHFENAEVHAQSRNLTPEERAKMLSYFVPNPQKTTVGLWILGGAFSEGVDLVSDRLIGVGIVGIGLPQVDYENDLIRNYHEEKGGHGFDYAYKDPGMNKVLQAVGRLIRSETDVGAALLIDDRYLNEEYRASLKRLYSDYEVVLSPEEVSESLDVFFSKR